MELQRYIVDTETRFVGEDQLVAHDAVYTIFWFGKSEKEMREAGVGIAVKNSLVGKIEQPIGVNDRIMTQISSCRWAIPDSFICLCTHSFFIENGITSFYHTNRSIVIIIPSAKSFSNDW